MSGIDEIKEYGLAFSNQPTPTQKKNKITINVTTSFFFQDLNDEIFNINRRVIDIPI
jgi:hypothetical protein